MDHSVTQKAEEITTLLHERLGVRAGDGFEAKFNSAGRRLPRWIRREGQVIVEAIALETHPKLAPRVDRRRANRALKNLRKYLKGVDPVKRRVGKVLDLLAAISLVVIVTAGLVVTAMVWRGML